MDIVDPFDQPTAKRGIVDPFDAPTPVSLMGPNAADAAAIAPLAKSDPNADSIGKALLGAQDVGSTLASRLTPAAMLPMLAGGVAGIASLPQGLDAATEKIRQTEQALSYEPQTAAGRVAAAAPDYVFNKIGQGADYLGQKTTDVTGSPLAGAGVSTAAQLLPLLLGERAVRGGIDTARAVRAGDLTRGDQSIPASIDTDMHGITDRASMSDMLTKGATDTPTPTPADGLKSMLDQVKTTIAQGLAPKPNEPESTPVQPPPPAVAAGLKAVTGGDPQKMAAVIQDAVGDKLKPGETPENLAAAVQSAKEPPNAANRPLATEQGAGGEGTGVDSAPNSPEAAARSAVLAEKPDAAPPLHPWTPVDTTKPIPLAGGVVEPELPGGPQKVAIDPRIPQFVKVDGKDIDAHEAIGLHERTEKTLMEQGLDYADAHDLATKAENAFVAKKYGIDPQTYQDALKPHIANALKEASNDPNIPPTLDTKPYTDEGDEHLLSERGTNPTVATDKNVAGKQGQRAASDESRRESDESRNARLDRVRYTEDDYRLPNIDKAVPSEHVPPQAKQKTVTIYRGVPDRVSDGIRPGDWVTLDRVYAERHGTEGTGSNRVVSMEVPAEHVAWAGTDMNEWFYSPRIDEQGNIKNDSTAPDSSGALDIRRLADLRQARDAGTATPEQMHELSALQDTAAHTADVNGELIPGVLNARGRTALEASGQMKPVRVKTDLDDFKTINDTLGHDVGDQALKLKAEAMRDAFGPGNVWREGGDEFGAHADTEEAAHAAMQQVRDRLSNASLEGVDPNGNPIAERRLGVSYGTGRGATHTEAAKAADNALLTDKAARKSAGLRSGRRASDEAGAVASGLGARGEGEGRGQVPDRGQEQEVAVAEPPTATKAEKPPPTKPVETATSAEPEKATGTSPRNAAIDADRERYGLDDLEPAEREHWEKPLAEAQAKIAADPSYPEHLAREVAAKPRALTTTETMALTADLKRLDDEHAAATQAILDAQESGDTNAEVRARTQQQGVLEAIDRNHEAIRKGGTEAARSLSIRNAILKDDYSLGRNMNRAKAAYGDKFNADLQKKVEDLSAKLKEKDDLIAGMQRKKQVDANTRMQAKLTKDIADMEAKLAKRLKVCPI